MKKSGFAKVRPSVLLRLKQLHEACVLQMEQRENPSLYNYQTMKLCQYLFKLSTVGMKNDIYTVFVYTFLHLGRLVEMAILFP